MVPPIISISWIHELYPSIFSAAVTNFFFCLLNSNKVICWWVVWWEIWVVPPIYQPYIHTQPPNVWVVGCGRTTPSMQIKLMCRKQKEDYHPNAWVVVHPMHWGGLILEFFRSYYAIQKRKFFFCFRFERPKQKQDMWYYTLFPIKLMGNKWYSH